MKEKGHGVFYFENIEGGHSGAADDQRAAPYMTALGYTFLIKALWAE
jgi:prolyl oligopeptidase